MSFTIHLQPAQRSFEVARDETILAAAIRQGIGLRRRRSVAEIDPRKGFRRKDKAQSAVLQIPIRLSPAAEQTF